MLEIETEAIAVIVAVLLFRIKINCKIHKVDGIYSFGIHCLAVT